MALSWFTILGMLLMSGLLAKGVWGIYNKSQDSTLRASTAKAELSKLIERRDALERNLKHIKSSAGVEAELRGKFDVAREGEHLLVIIDKEVKVPKPKVKDSWWSRRWHKWTQ